MSVRICGPGDDRFDIGRNTLFVNTTTSRNNTWGRNLSPMLLGPIQLANGHVSQNMENAWQYSKVYKCHTNTHNDPTSAYWRWALDGWNTKRGHRYPMGKGAIPEYAWWENEKLGYIDARKKIYIPLYSFLVKETKWFKLLKFLHDNGTNLWLWDWDGYDHKLIGMSLDDVLHCENRKMGHAFVIAMLLEGFIK